MEVVEDTRIDAGPVMDRHGHPPGQTTRDYTSATGWPHTRVALTRRPPLWHDPGLNRHGGRSPMTDRPRHFLDWIPFLWARVLFPAPQQAPTAVRLPSLLILIALPALLLYPTLSFRLLEPDEGRYAQIPREMLARG